MRLEAHGALSELKGRDFLLANLFRHIRQTYSACCARHIFHLQVPKRLSPQAPIHDSTDKRLHQVSIHSSNAILVFLLDRRSRRKIRPKKLSHLVPPSACRPGRRHQAPSPGVQEECGMSSRHMPGNEIYNLFLTDALVSTDHRL